MGLDYKLENTKPASRELTDRVIAQFRDAGCNAR
jgi:hypothetical protein